MDCLYFTSIPDTYFGYTTTKGKIIKELKFDYIILNEYNKKIIVNKSDVLIK